MLHRVMTFIYLFDGELISAVRIVVEVNNNLLLLSEDINDARQLATLITASCAIQV
jgi:hypothetical protein